MHSLSSAAAGNRSLRSLSSAAAGTLRAGTPALRAGAAPLPGAPPSVGRRRACSVQPLRRTLRGRRSFSGARSSGRARTPRPGGAPTEPGARLLPTIPAAHRTARDSGAPPSPHLAPLPGPSGSRAEQGAAGRLAGEGPCLRRKVGEQAPQLFYRNIPACAPGVPAPPVAASRVFPRTVGLSALRAGLEAGCAHAPVRGRPALALGLLRAPSRGSGRPASHGGQAHSRIHERARSALRPPVRPPVPPFRVGGAVGVGSWCRRRLQARGAQWAGKPALFSRARPRAPVDGGSRLYHINAICKAARA